jgi:DNA-binding NtrC family response regulator
MNPFRHSASELLIVDANAHDYSHLASELKRRQLQVHIYPSGEDALRASPATRWPLWMINVQLPDMPGITLLEHLRRRSSRSSVFLIADVHTAEAELAARSAGATAYLCKPPSAAWISGYFTCTTAIRAGPQLSATVQVSGNNHLSESHELGAGHDHERSASMGHQ